LSKQDEATLFATADAKIDYSGAPRAPMIVRA
jgi:hypothetical protein